MNRLNSAGQMNCPTSTAQWSLVIHRVSQTTAEVWVGTLFPTLKMPKRARVQLIDANRKVRTQEINKARWQRPFTKMGQRFFTVVTFQGLKAGSEYRLVFERRIEAEPQAGIKRRWQQLRSGTFRTLPSRIPEKGRDTFTVALGSCFYEHRDGGRAAASYKALYERGAKAVRPNISVFSGDQVYLDIGFDSLSLRPKEIRERIADDYAKHWQALGSMLTRGGTWMLPDDHEYWNDYPFYDSLIPTLLALKLPHVRETWRRAAGDAVKNIQRTRKIESFAVGNDLSVCLADLRSHRSCKTFLPKAAFQELLDWASQRTCPGVLVIPQPLIVNQSTSERNLRCYPTQYTQLIEALGTTCHDAVILSGDVHFGRIASVPIGTNGARLVEIVASPMSNLTFLNGIATNVAKASPKKFPPSDAAKALGWQPQKVNYYKDRKDQGRFFVQVRKGRWLSAYPKARTREHFMTVSFCRCPNGKGIELTADAWLVRERAVRKHLPVRSFAKPFRTILK